MMEGAEPWDAFSAFVKDIVRCERIIGHNVEFDIRMLVGNAFRAGDGIGHIIADAIANKEVMDTMKMGRNFCGCLNKRGNTKNPTLQELYQKVFGSSFPGAHNALYDVYATREVFLGLLEKGVPMISEVLSVPYYRSKSITDFFPKIE